MIEAARETLAALSGPSRILLALALAVGAHLLVRVVRRLGRGLLSARLPPTLAKVQTAGTLATSTLVFLLYFGALGVVLREFGVSLTAYLASASILGLAIGFGSQGLVQDLVTGLTVIFSDLFHVGDLVEIGGQIGVVEAVGMRFTTLINAMGATVSVPNRTITNVVIYPRGYVRCLLDATLPADPERAERALEAVRRVTAGAAEQFRGVLRTGPEVEPPRATEAGKRYVRVKFRLWPGRGAPIETTCRQEVVAPLKAIDPDYADWMVSVTYEVAQEPAGFRPRPRKR